MERSRTARNANVIDVDGAACVPLRVDEDTHHARLAHRHGGDPASGLNGALASGVGEVVVGRSLSLSEETAVAHEVRILSVLTLGVNPSISDGNTLEVDLRLLTLVVLLYDVRREVAVVVACIRLSVGVEQSKEVGVVPMRWRRRQKSHLKMGAWKFSPC